MKETTNPERRRFLKLAGGASITTVIAGCTGGGGDPEQEPETDTEAQDSTETTEEEDQGSSSDSVTVVQGQFAATLDPQNHAETATDNVLLSAYEQLLFRDREGGIIAELGTEWERVEDGRARFTIRDGVTFHSGDDLTPEDVAYSINRIARSDVGGIESPQASSLAPISGAEVVEDERAVDVLSEEGNPLVFSALAGQNGQVMQKSWVESRSDSEIAQDVNGTGPFELEAFEQDVRVAFRRFEDYWRDPASLDAVEFRSAEESSTRVNELLTGNADLVVNVPPQEVERVRGSDGARISAVSSLRMLFGAMRYDVEPFSSQEFRQAMNYAVDVQSIIDNALSGFGDPVSQPTQNGVFGHNPDLESYPHDPDRAESLVEESGHSGAEIELHTPIGRYLKDVEVAQAIAGQIDSLPNVSCSVNQRDFSALAAEVVNGDISTSPHFYLLGYANAIFDASFVIVPLLTRDGVLTSFADEETDELIAQAQRELDESRREELLQEANALYREKAPWVFLHQQASIYGLSERLAWEPRQDEHIDTYRMEVE